MTFLQAKSARSVLALVAALLLSSNYQFCAAAKSTGPQKALSDTQTDEQVFHQQAEIFCRAFHIGDADIIASLWTPDGTMVDSAGVSFTGRAAIKKAYEDFFANHGAQTISISIDRISFPTTDVAIEEGQSHLPESQSPPCHYTVVHVKRKGKWQLASVTEYQLPTQKSNNKDLSDLNWMVGNWTAKGKNGSIPVEMQWISNQNFLRCVYFSDDKKVVKGMKLVGWDPIRQELITWHFSSDGSYGIGAMDKQGSDWVEHTSCVESDGSLSSATYTIKQKDKDTFTWQSTQRQLNGAQLPDTDIVEVVRNK
jgi:uncharacterized protein (TIGR02246 family)